MNSSPILEIRNISCSIDGLESPVFEEVNLRVDEGSSRVTQGETCAE